MSNTPGTRLVQEWCHSRDGDLADLAARIDALLAPLVSAAGKVLHAYGPALTIAYLERNPMPMQAAMRALSEALRTLRGGPPDGE